MGKQALSAGAVKRQTQWRKQQRHFNASGQRVAQFCQDEGLSVATFHYRRARLKRLDREAAQPSCDALQASEFIDAGAVLISADGRVSNGVDSILPAQVQGGGAVTVRIELGGGVVLSISRP